MHMHMRCTCDAHAHAHAMHMHMRCTAHAMHTRCTCLWSGAEQREHRRYVARESARRDGGGGGGAAQRNLVCVAHLGEGRSRLSAPVTRSCNSHHPVPTHPYPAKSYRRARGLTGVLTPSRRVLAVFLPPLPKRVAHREQPTVCRREEQHCPLVRRELSAGIGRKDRLSLAACVLACVLSDAVSATSAGSHEPHCSLPLDLSGARPGRRAVALQDGPF
jgi:hypothetical protein